MNDENLTAKGRGRPKGAPNKIGKTIKEMILEALDSAGGVGYLLEQSEKNPNAFMTLVGKALPMEVKNEISGQLINRVERLIVKPNENPAD